MKLAHSVPLIPAATLVLLLSISAGLAPERAFAASRAKTTSPKASTLVDVNHATLEELKTLPGIEDANAAKIIKNRPYANKGQISSKGVLSAATYARIRKFIIAKQ